MNPGRNARVTEKEKNRIASKEIKVKLVILSRRRRIWKK